jgi:hypothetical protein
VKVRIVPIEASTGAYTDIAATIPCRRMEITDEGGTGFTLQRASEGFGTTETYAASTTAYLGNVVAHQNNQGDVLGWPQQETAGESIAADVVCKVRSKAGVGSVRVVEYE